MSQPISDRSGRISTPILVRELRQMIQSRYQIWQQRRRYRRHWDRLASGSQRVFNIRNLFVNIYINAKKAVRLLTLTRFILGTLFFVALGIVAKDLYHDAKHHKVILQPFRMPTLEKQGLTPEIMSNSIQQQIDDIRYRAQKDSPESTPVPKLELPNVKSSSEQGKAVKAATEIAQPEKERPDFHVPETGLTFWGLIHGIEELVEPVLRIAPTRITGTVEPVSNKFFEITLVGNEGTPERYQERFQMSVEDIRSIPYEVAKQILYHEDPYVRALFAFNSEKNADLALQISQEVLTKSDPYRGPGYILWGTILLNKQRFHSARLKFELATLDSGFESLGFEGMGMADLAQYEIPQAIQDFQKAIERDPTNQDAYYGLMEALQTRGSLGWAELEKLKSYVLKNPNNAVPYLAIASAEMRLRSDLGPTLLQDEINNLKIASEHDRKNALIRDRLGDAFSHAGMWGDAAREYQEAINLKPDYSEPYSGLSRALYQQGNPREAETVFDQYLDRNPATAASYNAFGSLLEEYSSSDRALLAYLKAIKMEPQNITYRLDAARLQFETETEHAGAISNFQRVLEIDPMNIEALAGLMHLYQDEFRLKDEDHLFEKYRFKNAEQARFWELWGIALSDRQKKSKALEKYLRAYKLDPDSYSNFIQMLYLLGKMHRSKDALDLAEKYRVTHLEDSSNNVTLAEQQEQQGLVNQALENYREAIRRQPGREQYYEGMSRLLDSQNRIEEVIPVYQAGIKQDRQNVNLYLGLARANQGAKHFDEALNAIQVAIHINPDYLSSFIAWSEILSAQNKNQEALAVIKAFARSHPWNKYVLQQWYLLMKKIGSPPNEVEEYNKAFASFPSNDADLSLSPIMPGHELKSPAGQMVARLNSAA